MKKLVSKEEKERKRKRNQIIVGVVLAFLMILSTLGFALQNSLGNMGNTQTTDFGDKVVYNGFEFSYVNGFWVLGNYVFRYNPKEVQPINTNNLRDATYYQGLPLYIYSENEDAKTEIYVNMINIALRIQEACPINTNCSGTDIPVKTCTSNFIIIKESDTNLIKQEDNCVYIEGKKDDIVKVSDEFLFKILKIR
ncbi:MAG: hypothetical protein QXD05_00885 [Candidatus Pacearchaeota archaeon]